MILKSVEVEFGPSVTVGLIEGEEPLGFINQGKQGIFLWFIGFATAPLKVPVIDHTFHFVGKGEPVQASWTKFGSIKNGKYYWVFKE